MVANAPLDATLVLAACSAARGIGKSGGLPLLKLIGDLKRFEALDLGHAVLMGLSTSSLPTQPDKPSLQSTDCKLETCHRNDARVISFLCMPLA